MLSRFGKFALLLHRDADIGFKHACIDRIIDSLNQPETAPKPAFCLAQVTRTQGQRPHIAEGNGCRRDFSYPFSNLQGTLEESLRQTMLCFSQVNIAQITTDNGYLSLAIILLEQRQRRVPVSNRG